MGVSLTHSRWPGILAADAMNCAFWNLNSRPRAGIVAELCKTLDVGLLMLAECEVAPPAVLAALADVGLNDFVYASRPAGVISRLTLVARTFVVSMEDVGDDANGHYTIRRLVFAAGPELLLVVAHLPSKLYREPSSQTQTALRLAARIRAEEEKAGHSRTVLVGDLNMNPFEDGLVGSEYLHGVMTTRIAERGGRVVDHEHRPYFYNPMWQFFGDQSDGPPGTYFYNGGGHTTYFWNVFDQVLVRPSIMRKLSGVQILDRVGSRSLTRRQSGRPDKSVGSDHLPLLFSLDL